MAGKEHLHLTDAAIAGLRPREREYTVPPPMPPWENARTWPEPVSKEPIPMSPPAT